MLGTMENAKLETTASQPAGRVSPPVARAGQRRSAGCSRVEELRAPRNPVAAQRATRRPRGGLAALSLRPNPADKR